MQRVKMRPIGPPPKVACWNCGAQVAVERGKRGARYLYRGEQPSTVIVEDWVPCACGAFQNIRHLNEVIIDAVEHHGTAEEA
jgi:hypothetical protein